MYILSAVFIKRGKENKNGFVRLFYTQMNYNAIKCIYMTFEKYFDCNRWKMRFNAFLYIYNAILQFPIMVTMIINQLKNYHKFKEGKTVGGRARERVKLKCKQKL